MSEYFIFGDVDSRSFYVDAYELDTFGAKGRHYDDVEIPGRSGNILIDGKRYPNTEHSYGCIIYQNTEANIDNFRNALISQVGYKRLEDSMHTAEFYKACYKDDFIISMDESRSLAKMQVVFERKPQRYLKSGETKINLTKSGSVTNPTRFDAQPLLRVYGKGVLQIADNAITVITSDQYVDIDCEIMEAYKGTASYNDMIKIQNIDFPVFHPGANGIVLGSGITKVEITPRWYKL